MDPALLKNSSRSASSSQGLVKDAVMAQLAVALVVASHLLLLPAGNPRRALGRWAPRATGAGWE